MRGGHHHQPAGGRGAGPPVGRGAGPPGAEVRVGPLDGGVGPARRRRRGSCPGIIKLCIKFIKSVGEEYQVLKKGT